MPIVIDLSTPEKMDAFGKAMLSAAKGENPVSLADVAEASKTLRGPKVCYETDHYRIVDHGTDWEGRYTGRYAVERRPEFVKSRVMPVMPHLSNTSAESLLDSLKKAEQFHMENLPHCGGF
jgi:hypothetical protein